MPIYFTSLEDPTTTDNVLAFLEPYIPYALGPIGTIVNSRPELVKTIKVYTSFEVDFSKPFQFQPLPTPASSTGAEPGSKPLPPPVLFSIIALQPREQARFFCSADLKTPEPATPEEEAHVQEFFRAVIPIVADLPPDSEDGPTPEYDLDPIGLRGRGYHLSRVNEKWAPCLSPITTQLFGPLVCLIRPPPPPQEASLPNGPPTAIEAPDRRKSDRWIISRFRPSDIDIIKSTSLIPRHKTYLESRVHASISIYDSHITETSKSNLVAWSLIQADGSFGVLWVESSHRGLGLGDLALNECLNRSGTYHGFSGNQATGAGIIGWQWADVSPMNPSSIRFFSKQEGWIIGWGTWWLTLDPDIDLTTVDWSFRQVRAEKSKMRGWGKNPKFLLTTDDES